jgi:hypothetical protein
VSEREAEYADWIERYVSSFNNRFVRGRCEDAVRLMVKQFPELRAARGFAHVSWGEDQHWWCVAPDGTVVDPTVSQFPRMPRYEELDLSRAEDRARVPIGKCMNCGARTFVSSPSAATCSIACERELTEAFG